MLEYFIPDELLEESLDPYSATDVASFQDIWEAANSVLVDCMGDSKRLGWAAVGKELPLLTEANRQVTRPKNC